MATTISTGNSDNDTITGVRLDIARLEGMLTAFLTDGMRRIENTEKVSERLRTDLDAVKMEAKADIRAFKDEINAMAMKGRTEGNLVLQTLNENITTNKNNITELRGDIVEVKEKQNASLGRAILIISPCIAAISLLWNVIGK